MKPINEMRIKLLSKSSNEGFARSAVAMFFAQLDPTVDEVSDIKTAVSEAVTNCIVHGYKDKIGNIYITAKIYEGNKVVVQIKDNGCGIPDIDKAMEPMFTTCETGERAGLGFAVMQSFMDKVKVRSKVSKGTTVTLGKTLLSRGESNEHNR